MVKLMNCFARVLTHLNNVSHTHTHHTEQIQYRTQYIKIRMTFVSCEKMCVHVISIEEPRKYVSAVSHMFSEEGGHKFDVTGSINIHGIQLISNRLIGNDHTQMLGN